MKAIIASDIHDDLKAASFLINKVKREKFDNLLLLGDIGYEATLKFNEIASKIVACKGNNDTLNIVSLAKFQMNEISYYVFDKSKLFVLTHGDRFSFDDYMYYYGDKFDVFLSGHTHIAKMEVIRNKLVLNPGSISIPRDEYHSYMIIDEKEVKLIDYKTDKVINSIVDWR